MRRNALGIAGESGVVHIEKSAEPGQIEESTAELVSEMVTAGSISKDSTIDYSAEVHLCTSQPTHNNDDTGIHNCERRTAEPVLKNLQLGPERSTTSHTMPTESCPITTALDEEQAKNARRLGNAKYKSLLSDFSDGHEEDPDNIEPQGPLDKEHDRKRDPEVYKNTYANVRISVSSDDMTVTSHSRTVRKRVTLNPSVEVIDRETGALSQAPLRVNRGEPANGFRRLMWRIKKRITFLVQGRHGRR
ncbi:hypothetical protein FPQ18DRAFT_302620 [Pyronema domesticum]|nr:hypothetical protein FPQ18DRAFT_302620 [Pyronema domesticum]